MTNKPTRGGKPLNTDPERARKRATSDLRCAVRKLWPDLLSDLERQPYFEDGAGGYVEGDNDYLARHRELCVAFLEAIQ